MIPIMIFVCDIAIALVSVVITRYFTLKEIAKGTITISRKDDGLMFLSLDLHMDIDELKKTRRIMLDVADNSNNFQIEESDET